MLLLYIALAALAGSTSYALPKCDSNLIAAIGTPITNITKEMDANGQYSYVRVSTEETTLAGMQVKCLGLEIVDDDTGKATYKFGLFPKITLSFPIKEENGCILQTTGSQQNKFVVTYMKNGVVCTMRCCDTCTGSTPNVGCAVANALKNSAATKTALADGVAKMQSLGVWTGVSELASC